MLRPVFVLISILFVYSTATADPIQLAGTATGAFNGNPLSTNASLAGVTFTGGPFSFEPLPNDPFQQIGIRSNALGTLTYNGSAAGLTSSDIFTLNLAFDDGSNFSFSFRLQPLPDINVIGFSPLNPGFSVISFMSGSHFVEGHFGVAIDNLRPFAPTSSFRTIILFDSVTPPVETPEPASIVLLGLGILGGARIFKRMRR